MKYQGTVKWFSNKKGFGFIAPTSENAPTKDEIFVHQTAIVTDGQYRTLKVRLVLSVTSSTIFCRNIPSPGPTRAKDRVEINCEAWGVAVGLTSASSS